MGATIISSREFNQDVSKAKRKARKGPVFITDRGQPSHVLLSIDAYEKISHSEAGIVDLLAMSKGGAGAFEPIRLDKPLHRPADL